LKILLPALSSSLSMSLKGKSFIKVSGSMRQYLTGITIDM